MNNIDLSQQVEQLKLFLAMGPTNWSDKSLSIKRFYLPNSDVLSCILWNNLFYITGTDIVKVLVFRFLAIGRPVNNMKKFEEGVFSDLRNLKAGQDAILEEPRSEFLEFLYKNNCIRTQKKQKVFFWYSVPHDRLFVDALERDLKREAMGQESATIRSSAFHAAMPIPMFNNQQNYNNSALSNSVQMSSPNPRPSIIPNAKEQQEQPQFQRTPSQESAEINLDDINLDEWIDDETLQNSFTSEPHNDILSSHLDAMEALSSILEQSLDTTTMFHNQSRKQSIQISTPPALDYQKLLYPAPSQQLTPSPSHDHPPMIQNLIPIAPKMMPSPPSLLPSPSIAGIKLEGSPNYKKQRRRSSILRMSQSRPYNNSNNNMQRRHSVAASSLNGHSNFGIYQNSFSMPL